MNPEEKKKLQVMLRRIQGQVGGIGKMIEGDKSCEEVLTQISAAVSSLKSVGRSLLVEEAIKCDEKRGKEDYSKLLKRYL